MSSFTVRNTTNSRSNTLPNTLAPGAVTVTGYTQGGVTITSTPISNSTIESTTTNYKYQGTDIGSIYCAKYNGYAGPATGTIPVSNYSSCTIVMVGGGGGGGGSQFSPLVTGGDGGDGGIAIFQKIPLVDVTNINYSVGSGGARGVGTQTFPIRNATAGSAGNATTVTISSTTYTANGGSGGPLAPTSASSGNVTPTGSLTFQGTLNGPLTYQSSPDRVITFPTTPTPTAVSYGQGGAGGNANPASGNNGQVGTAGYLRIYLYP